MAGRPFPFVAASLLALVAGCGPATMWARPGAPVDAAERAKDDNWCAVLGEMEVQNLPDNQRFRAYAVWRETYEGCMAGKGYARAPAAP